MEEVKVQKLMFANCVRCEYLDTRPGSAGTCEAYPKGIPNDIVTGKDMHIVSRGDDNGIVFKPAEGFSSDW